MGIYLSYILYGDFSHTFCMGISLIHFVWDSTFFLLKSGPSSGTGKAPIAEGRALLEVEVLQYCTGYNSIQARVVLKTGVLAIFAFFAL
jgi:hypothetical protein